MQTTQKRRFKRAVLSILLLLLLGGVAQTIAHYVNPSAPQKSAQTIQLNSGETPPVRACCAGSSETTTATDPDVDPVFSSFELWAEKAAAEKPGEAEIQKGVALARTRRAALSQLIQSDPKRALEKALPVRLRGVMPEAVAGELEERIDARGSYLVAIADNPGQESVTTRTAEVNGKRYRAYAYGKRMGLGSKVDIPLHGIAVGEHLALSESPVRVLELGEEPDPRKPIANPDGKCPIKGVISRDVAVDAGHQTYYMCCMNCANELSNQLIAAEGGPGPLALLDPSASIAASSWTQGNKTTLIINVKFSDQADTTAHSLASLQTMMTGCDAFMQANSYGTSSMTSTFTPLLVLPNTEAYYVTNGDSILYSDARTKATAAGFNYANFDRDAVCWVGGPGSYGGQAYVGARGCWLKSTTAGVAAHEFGHNHGLWHANYWATTDGSTIGSGSNQEYGDSFDTMGSANAGNYHYVPYEKNLLGWIPTANVTSVTTSGTYRIYPHDETVLVPTSMYGLKFAKTGDSSARTYWVDFRQKWTSNRWLMSGAELHWGSWGSSNGGGQLLDTTPGSPSGKSDSAIVIGRTFADKAAGVYVTPVGKGGTTPESIDVVVNLGTFPSNLAPSVSIGASATTVATGTVVNFTATASDPNGDTLAYYWDFGDDTFGTNSPSASHSWSAAAERLVRCVVSDMKGGEAQASILITIGAPTTFHIAGTVTSGGSPMEGVRVSVSASQVTYTNSDGTYNLVGLPAGSYTVSANKFGYTMTASGFTNPVVVGPSATGINFTGALQTWSISGTITDGGIAASGVTVSDGTRSATTSASGTYTITGVPDGAYTITATKSGSTFIPSGFTNPISVQGANRTAINFVTPVYTISGQVTGPAASVVVTDGVRTTSTFKQGSNWVYTLSNVPAGKWNLRATLSGWSISPSTFTNPVTVTNANLTNQNFSGVAGTVFSISGNITASGSPLTGALVSDGTRSSTTDSLGNYCIVNVPNGSYTLTPTDAGFTFSPTTLAVTVAGANLTGKNFTASNGLPLVTVAATDAAASETGPDTGTFTITRTGSTAAALTVNYAMSGTATNGTDYTSLSGSVTIAAGSATATVTLTPIDDSAFEGNETAILTISANAAYAVGSPGSATVTIADNDSAPTVTVAATDAAASETGPDTGTYTITRTGSTAAALTVNYAMSGTATNGTDYTTLSGSVTIAAGSATATVTLTPIDDSAFEGSETAILTISANAAYTVGSPSSATVTIADNDLPTVTVTATDATASETAGDTGTFTITRTGSTAAALTVSYAMSGTATNGTDYNSLSGSVTIAAGSATATVVVTPIDDVLVEGNETAILTISANAAYTVGSPSSATVTIADNDSLPTVTVTATDATASETAGDTGTFTITRTGSTTAALTVSYAMSGTATNGTDYNSLSGSVTIAAGSATATVTVTPIDDVLAEGNETAILTISANAAYTVGSPSSATVTITDNDVPTVTVAATDAAASETGPDTGTYTITRTGSTTAALTVNYAMSGTATNGTDYTTLSGSVTIAAGSATATVTLTPIDDALFEGSETAILTLSNSVAYSVGSPGSATVTIADNDLPTVTVTATDASASETAPNTGTYTITRTGSTAAALTVNYAMSGTATNGTDYTSLSGSVTIAAGSATATVTLTPIDDALVEGNETAILTISANAAYTVGSPASATVTIADNDVANTPPTISNIANLTINEDTATSAIPFTVGDTQTAANLLTVSGTSSNTTLVPNGNIVFGGSGANRTVTITPVANGFGTTTITVTVSDGSLTASDTFVLTVTSVNDVPVANSQTVSTLKRTPVAITLTATDVETPVLTYTIVTQPSRGTLSGTAPNVTYTPSSGFSGTDSFTFSASDGTASSNIATVTINVTRTAPTLASTLTATPNPALVGQAVSFPAAATDADGDPLTYSWNFGDGNSGSNANAAHAYAAAGVYQAMVTVTDSDGLTTSGSVSVTVNTAGGGGSAPVDSDGDGVSDDNEIADGTNPFDPNSFVMIPMPVSKMAGKVKFSGGGTDACAIAGVIPKLPKLFDTTGINFVLNIGGAKSSFTLDSKGRGKTATGSIALKLKPSTRNPTTKKVEFQGGDVAFAAKLSGGTWMSVWNLDPKANSANVPMPMAVTVQLDGHVYGATVTVTYSSKAGVGGKFKK